MVGWFSVSLRFCVTAQAGAFSFVVISCFPMSIFVHGIEARFGMNLDCTRCACPPCNKLDHCLQVLIWPARIWTSQIPQQLGHNAIRRSGPGQQHALLRRTGTCGLSLSMGRLAWVRYQIIALSNLVVRVLSPPVRLSFLCRMSQRCSIGLIARHHGPGHAGYFVGQSDSSNHR